MSQQMSGAELDRLLNAFLDKMIVAAEKKLTDAQAVEELSKHEATLAFAEAKPCWMGEEL
jgi:hypothetical protein